MTTFLFYFTPRWGGADAQSHAGGGSGLRGQRYTPPAAQRLRAVHPAGGTEADARGWIVPEQTAALYQQNGEAWRCLATFPPAG